VYNRQEILNNRTGFVFYFDWGKIINKLNDEQAGSLLRAIIKAAMEGEDTDFSDDLVLDMAFVGIRDTINRDTEKYIKKAEKNRENGKLGGRPKNPQKPNGYFGLSTETQQNPKKPDIDIDTDTDIERDNDIDIDGDIDRDNERIIGNGYVVKYVIEDFKNVWNANVKHGVKQLYEFTAEQQRRLEQLVIKHDWIKVRDAVDSIQYSDYLLGKTNGGKAIELDWFLREQNMLKVASHTYDTKGKRPQRGWQSAI
jgi:hypothetical protein